MLVVSLSNFVFFCYIFIENCVNFSGRGIIWGVLEVKSGITDKEMALIIKPVQSLKQCNTGEFKL